MNYVCEKLTNLFINFGKQNRNGAENIDSDMDFISKQDSLKFSKNKNVFIFNSCVK